MGTREDCKRGEHTTDNQGLCWWCGKCACELHGEPRAVVVYEFVVPGRAQQRGSKIPWLPKRRDGSLVMKNGRPVIATMDSNKRSGLWMQEVRAEAIAQLGRIELLTGPIELTARFYFARPQSHYGSGKNAGKLKSSAPEHHAQSPDVDKILRALGDSLTGVVILDDKQIVSISGTRYWTTAQERTEVIIQELG